MAAIYDALGNYAGEDSNGGTTTVVANPPKLPTTNTVPNTTTNTKKVVYQTAAKDSAVKPASDPSQFPAYDDIGNLQPGFKINEETGQTYYAGVGPSTKDTPVLPTSDPSLGVMPDPSGSGGFVNANGNPVTANGVVIPAVPPTTYSSPVNLNNGGEGFTLGTSDGNGGFVNAQGDPVDSNGMPIAGVPPTTYSAPVNDAYAGLTPEQIQFLGNADPTDPYIRARGGLPQLPGSTLFATAGFGTLKTGVPLIDSALGTIGGLFGGLLGGGAGGGSGLSSLFTNFSATVGGLFGAKPTATTLAAKTGSGVAALEAPATGPPAAKAAVDTNNGGEGFSLGTPDGNGGFVNAQGNPVDSTGMPIAGVPPTTYPAGPTLINGDPFDPQLGADAAKLSATTSPGNQNLKNIEGATAEIAKNKIEIQNANEANASADQYILDSQTQIAINNTELADPNISDARRAQLEANNAQQALAIDQNQNVIDQNNDRVAVLEKNTQYNEAVAQTNANAYEITGQGGDAPSQVSALEDPSAAAAERNDAANVDALAAAQGERNDAAAVDATQDLQNERNDAAAVDARPGPGESVFDPANVDTNSDPFEQARFDAQQAADAGPVDLGPNDVAVMSDAEADALDAQQAENRRVLAEQATDVEPGEDPGIGGGGTNGASEFGTDAAFAAQEQGSQEAAIKQKAQNQATIQARYKQPGNTDWRVRLSLAPGANYLYNDPSADILKPLRYGSGTDGVIFPYTPQISTAYKANYEQYDLIHSNYRGIFYKNSRVDDISIRGTFTAQDTQEANYLLAVIHFFRSATKMFYGQDPQRGTPPPICLLNGFGQYQFSDHPVVISSFSYNLPNDVDYIRTTNPNNFGLNLADKYNNSGASGKAGSASTAGLNRLLNALLPKGATPKVPGPPNTVAGSVSNQTPSSYVPTKMEIDITLIPVQTRSQVSQQFSLQGFASGQLLKGGFW